MPENSRPPGAQRRRRTSPKPAEYRNAASAPVLTLSPDDYVPTAFIDLGVPASVDFGLAAAGFTAPFAIQTKAIPVATAVLVISLSVFQIGLVVGREWTGAQR